MPADARRSVPRTDDLLRDGLVVRAGRGLHPDVVRAAVRRAQSRARAADLDPGAVARAAAAELLDRPDEGEVLNATGVVVHTNLGRSVLSTPARDALAGAMANTPLEHDLVSGRRARRGRGATRLLLDRVPPAQDALVVNNGAAALLLATLAVPGEIVIARGELVEIGDGFRLHELLASTGGRLHEVGATNRVTVQDYVRALGPATGCLLKVHPSNFTVHGFTSAPPAGDLAGLGVPLVVDLGSGLLAPHPLLPAEPDAATTLTAGAALVTFSTDKLLGGPQGGVLMGDATLVERARRHPLARALRIDKLSLTALAATLRQEGDPPTAAALARTPEELRARVEALRERVGGTVVATASVIGGGGAPGQEFPSWALRLPAGVAATLRTGTPPVVARVHREATLVDLRCIHPDDDTRVAAAVQAALTAGP